MKPRSDMGFSLSGRGPIWRCPRKVSIGKVKRGHKETIKSKAQKVATATAFLILD